MKSTKLKKSNKNLKAENPSGFLILTRRYGERIILGEGAEFIVTYLGKGFNDAIKIGIEASKELPVWREEVYLRIKAEEETSE